MDPVGGRKGRRRPSLRLAAREHEAVEHVFSYTPAVTAGADRGNEVALTFDDGPGPYTQQLVHVLDKFGAKATFFEIGEEERWFSDGTRLELRSGDVIGDHTETDDPPPRGQPVPTSVAGD